MLLDCSHIAAGPMNQTMEFLCKSVEEAGLWHPHPTDRLLSAMEAVSTTWMSQALQGIQALALHAFGVAGADSLREVLAKAKTEDVAVKCRALEKKMAGLEPGSLSLDDYLSVIDCWLFRYLPPALAVQKAKRTAIQQYLVGLARHDTSPTTTEAAMTVVETLPATVGMGTDHYRLSAFDHARIHVAEATAARHIGNLTQATRSAMHDIVIRAEQRRLTSGTTTYDPVPLQQHLSDAFGELNRDWRRIAVTETSLNATDGYLSRLKPGEQVKWLAHPGACRYCESQNGKRFTVVAPDHPRKDPFTQVWVGKSVENIGRSISPRKRLEDGSLANRTAAEMLVPAITAHPSCRCLYVALVVTGGKVVHG